MEALFHGNVTQDRALELIKIVEDKLADTQGGQRKACKPIRKSQQAVLREVQLSPNTSSVYLEETSVHKSSCIEIYYQWGPRSTHSDMVLEMVCQILSEPCFDQLRTKEQLGYIVWSGMRRKAGVQGFRVIVMSDRHPTYLDERIELFLDTMTETLKDISDESFAKHKAAVKAKILEKPKRLSARTSKYWAEIYHGYLNFNRVEIETTELEKVTKEGVFEHFKEHVSAQSGQRKKISTHVVSKTEDGAGTVEQKDIPKGSQKIQTFEEFRCHQGLFPTMKPFADPTTMRNKNYVKEN